MTTYFSKNYGIACFSEERDNAVCWKRYGDEGRGLCLVFKIDREKLEKVEYVDKVREVCFPEAALESWKRAGRLTDEIAETLYPCAIKKYKTKFRRWQDEKEWRAFPRLDHHSVTSAGLYFSDDWEQNHIELKSVMLGASCSATIAQVRVALEGHYRKHPNSGEVKIECVNR